MTGAGGGKDAVHHQVEVTARSPRREMCDVTTAMFAIFHTCAEIRGWVTTRLVTALLMYSRMMTRKFTTEIPSLVMANVITKSTILAMENVQLKSVRSESESVLATTPMRKYTTMA